MLLPGESFEELSRGVRMIVSKNHTFGTDTMLLADFSMPQKHEIAVDLGTGCGAIPLYWCSVAEVRQVFAVDIQEDACAQLRRSVEVCNLTDKIKVLHKDLREPIAEIVSNSCDLVVCNPPYKALGAGLTSSNMQKCIAKHEKECTIADITKCAAKLLKRRGRLCMCQRVDRLCDVLVAMRASGIEPKRFRLVQQRKGSVPKLFLVEGRLGGRPGMVAMTTLIIENDDGGFSPEIRRIYRFEEGNDR